MSLAARRLRAVALAALVLLALLALPAAAAANTVTSQNWSGYAIHRQGVRFARASATWREPLAACTTGTRTYSSFWVGIGGYSLSSNAMEQIGSELDCEADGTQSLSAWYELVPAPTRSLTMRIGGGDELNAAIAVTGHRVTLTLRDLTRHESFAKTVVVRTVDQSSAEWIAEAPSNCGSSNACTTLPLTAFGPVGFEDAAAQTTSGHTDGITSPRWTTTKILLGYATHAGRFTAKGTTASATPSPLVDAGRAFFVVYSGASSTAGTGSGITTATGSGGTTGSGGASGTGGTTGTGGTSGTGSTQPGGPPSGGSGPGGGFAGGQPGGAGGTSAGP